MTQFSTIASIRAAKLEDWLRDRYFDARLDISSSGMANYSIGELRDLLQISVAELDSIMFRDSPSYGSDVLREVIAARYAQSRSETIMVTHGSSEAIFLAVAAIVHPGDEIVVVEPAYQSLTSIAEALGATLVPWRLHAANGFQPDFDELRGLVTRRTRAVVVNSPHNPSGAVLSEMDVQKLMGLIDESGCWLLWDAAFGDISYEQNQVPAPPQHPSVVSFGTLSKAFGLPGIRVGWCIAPPTLIDHMVRIRDYTTLNTSPVNEYLAFRVLAEADRVLAPLLANAGQNRMIMADWAQSHADLIELTLPAGGVCAFPKVIGATEMSGMADAMLARHGVLIAPGECFGHPDRFRLGFGGDTQELVEALGLVVEVLGDSMRGKAAR